MDAISKKISDLNLDPSNARKHDKKNLAAIKGSLSKFGQQKPIVISKDNVIIAGNGTYMAAKELGWDNIDCVVTELSGTEAIAFALADNKTAELAEWDDEVLKKTIDALLKEEFDIGDIGFDIGDFPGMEKKSGNTEDDEVPEVPQNIHNVKLGDIWQLGNHRLMCGDSTVKENVDKLMAGKKADMVFTDPPYGIAYADCSSVTGISNLKGKKYKAIKNDETDFDVYPVLELFKDTPEIFVWGGDYLIKREDIRTGSLLIWDKRIGNQDSLPGSHFEICWSKNRHGRIFLRYPWVGVMAVDPGEKRTHPTQKCIKMIVEMLERWGKNTQIVADLFLGSGSTLIACEKTNRICYGMELDPHYCSVIIERWQNFTGKKANLLSANN